MITIDEPVSRRWPAIGTWCEVLLWLPGVPELQRQSMADRARDTAASFLAELDRACSRFRPDSELSRLRHGTTTTVSEMLNGALGAALRTARATEGLVDPTVATALAASGYDADLDVVRARAESELGRDTPERPDACGDEVTHDEQIPTPGHWRIQHDPLRREVLVPHRIALDFGASAKAWAADRLASRLLVDLPDHAGGVLVNLGGDLAVAGTTPTGGWRVRVDDAGSTDDLPEHAASAMVAIRSGGLATSSTTLRTWRRNGELRHHIIDPRTGRSAALTWQTVTVAARSCELANAASTAAVVLGSPAPSWLARHGVDARLRGADGGVVRVNRWPAEELS